MGKRGPQAKPASERRTHEIRVYLTDAELADLDKRADEKDQSRSGFIRSRLFESATVTP